MIFNVLKNNECNIFIISCDFNGMVCNKLLVTKELAGEIAYRKNITICLNRLTTLKNK